MTSLLLWLARKDKGSKWPQVSGYQGTSLLATDILQAPMTSSGHGIPKLTVIHWT